MAENKINKPEQEEEKKKKSLAVWWKGLNKGVRTTICILGGAAVATAVVVPTVIAAKGCAGKRVPQIDSSITNVTCTYKLVDGNMEITLACSDATKEIADIESITIGNTILVKGTDYTYDASSQKIIIKKATLDKDSGTIIVKPLVIQKLDVDKFFTFTKIGETETCKIEPKSGVTDKLPTPLYLPKKATIDGKEYSVVEMSNFSSGNYSNDTTIILPSTMKTIGGGCFFNCSQPIKKVVLNDGLEEIGGCAFYKCNALEEINIPASLTLSSLATKYAFDSTTSLSTVVLDNQDFVNSPNYCYKLLSYAKNIYIKDGLTEPSNTTYIKTQGFTKQDTSDRPGYSKWVSEKNKFQFKNIDATTCYIAPNPHSIFDDDVTMPTTDGADPAHTVTAIENNSFMGSSFNTLTMPSTLTKIEQNGIAFCNIKKIKLNNGLTDIGDSAFNTIKGLEEINIPSSITTLHKGSSSAFCNCTSLKTVVIDSQEIASATNSLVHGDVYSFAETVYIKDNLTDPTTGQHVFNNYNKQATSDRLGYNKWTKK